MLESEANSNDGNQCYSIKLIYFIQKQPSSSAIENKGCKIYSQNLEKLLCAAHFSKGIGKT